MFYFNVKSKQKHSQWVLCTIVFNRADDTGPREEHCLNGQLS